MQYDLRNAVYERLQRLDFARHDQLQTGQLVSRASSDVGLLQGLLSFLPIMLGNLVLLGRGARGDAVPVAAADARRACSPCPCCWSWRSGCARRSSPRAGTRSSGPARWPASSTRRSPACGSSRGSARRSASSRTSPTLARTCSGPASGSSGCRPGSRRRCRPSRCWRRSRCSPSAAGWRSNGHISLGTFLAFSTYLVQLVAPVRMFAALIAVGQQARAGGERILDLLDANSESSERPDAIELPQAVTATCASTTSASATRRASPCSTASSCTVAPARRVALVGASGSGKSTVSRCCCPASTTWRTGE